MRAMLMATTRSGRLSVVLIAALAALLALSIGPLANPSSALAGTASTMESKILSWINAERDKKRLAPLRLRASLVDLAGDRARKMASTGDLKHAPCLSCKLRKRGISFNTCAEVISYTTYPWGDQAAWSIFSGWKKSSMHWGILMSSRYDYIGIGVAYRSSSRSTFAASVLTG
jgi:uncharacterized protein YkwD